MRVIVLSASSCGCGSPTEEATPAAQTSVAAGGAAGGLLADRDVDVSSPAERSWVIL